MVVYIGSSIQSFIWLGFSVLGKILFLSKVGHFHQRVIKPDDLFVMSAYAKIHLDMKALWGIDTDDSFVIIL